LAALLPCDATTTDRVAKRLKLSNKHREELAALANVEQPYAQQTRSLAYRLGIEAARDLIVLRADDREWQSALAALDNWAPPIFPIKGGMLIARGLPPGKLVTATLRAVENQWIDEGFPDPERANAIADQLVTSALHSAKKA
jgi:poly(A) polymerase